jgi:hypothetical protein
MKERLDDESATPRIAQEGRVASTGFLVLPVLAMLMIFSGIILQWGLGPIVAIGMAVTLGAVAERLSRRGGPQAGGGSPGWTRGLLHVAAELATRAEREPDHGRTE